MRREARSQLARAEFARGRRAIALLRWRRGFAPLVARTACGFACGSGRSPRAPRQYNDCLVCAFSPCRGSSKLYVAVRGSGPVVFRGSPAG